jgi:CheY-like chemotaxis protein
MGGKITVDSTPGQGSCFQFCIQVGVATTEVISSSLSHEYIVGIVPGQTVYRILVVEDNSTNRLLLRKILVQLGFAIQEAENGQAAIAVWKHWRPHLILMDMSMPILNGYQATQQIREQERELLLASPSTIGTKDVTKIIAITASTFVEQRQQALAIGCDDFVGKPFRQQEILETIARHLDIQYVYESNTSDTMVSNLSLNRTEYILDREALNVMPVEWIAQLHTAAIQGNDTSSLSLIAQIPSEHVLLIRFLTQLIETYQFDEVVLITQV